MRNNRIFWGFVLILLGGLFLMQTLGLLPWNAWAYFWPLFLILLGAWVLLRPRLGGRAQAEVQNLNIPLENGQEGVIEFNHGAGRLLVSGGAAPANLMEGSFVGGVRHAVRREAGKVNLKLSADPVITPLDIPWLGGEEGLRWDVRLANGLPLDLTFHTGAGEGKINLRDVNAQKVLLETGASSTEIILPANTPYTRVDVHAGAASVVLRVPAGVAGRIVLDSGLVGTKIDPQRFPRIGSQYETPGYASAEKRVEIKVEAGAGSIEVISD
ncbi:MAG: DUF5668 domain-containing protein [Bellilinea sp.]|jgi:hypothetical protein